MILDWIYENFGILEYLFCIQIVVLLAAAFFYQVAKLIARTDRRDPLVTFYRVFWRSFFTGVTPMRELDLMQVEMMARRAGIAMAGDLDRSQLERLDAPDLTDLGSLESAFTAPGGSDGAGDPVAKPIGRTGPEDEDILRPKKNAESRESRFARKQREQKAADIAAEAAAPSDEPIKVTRERPERAERPARGVDAVKEIPRAATSRFNARVVPFCTEDSIVGYQGGEVVFNVIYAPEDGHANGVIIELIAERIGVRPYQISLVGGHYKVRKTLQVAGLDQTTLDSRISHL